MMKPAGRAVTLFGQLDPIKPDGSLSGWCWSPQEPQTHRTIALSSNGRRLITGVCNQYRELLLGLGIGDGTHAFSVRIPLELLVGATDLQLEDVASGQPVGAAIPIKDIVAAASSPPPAVVTTRAFVEQVTPEGMVRGWAWNPGRTDERLRLAVTVNDETVGYTVADSFRIDLAEAGIGDGSHAFTFLLPWDVVAAKSVAQIGLIDGRSGEILHASGVFRRQALLSVEDRLHELERQIRLFDARLTDANNQARRDAAMLGGVLGTIGAFFTRLAQTSIEAMPTTLVPSLSGLVEDAEARLQPFSLVLSAKPVLTLCVQAEGTLDNIYACLQSIHVAGLDDVAEVVLIDDGSTGDAMLLPSLVQNLRYWRLQPNQSLVEARNRATLPAGRKLVAFLSSAVRVTSGWLPQMLATFERTPSCAVLATKLVRLDGTIHAAGLLPDRTGYLADTCRAEPQHLPRCDVLAPVAAAVDQAIIVRGEVFAQLNGFDPAYVDPAAATVDLCLRCWESGHSVFVQPACPLGWFGSTGIVSPWDGVDVDLSATLTHRWLGMERRAWPETVGRALLLIDPADEFPPTTDTLAVAAALQRLGYAVSTVQPFDMSADPASGPALRAAGVSVLRAPFQSGVAAALAPPAGPFDLAVLTAAAATSVPASRVRELSPGTRTGLLLDARAEAALAAEAAGPILEASAQSDVVVARSAAGLARLRRDGHAAKARLLGAATQRRFEQRDGLWLALDPADTAALSWRWFVRSVLPALRRMLPAVPMHAFDNGGRNPPRGIVMHTPGSDTASLLTSMRLAIAPLQGPSAGMAHIESCLAAGLPVVSTQSPSEEGLPPGLLVIKEEAFAKTVAAVYFERARWETLAYAIPVSAGETVSLATSLGSLLGELGLPLHILPPSA